ncbi:MAG: acyl carrier protein [Oscillospiraceae bacterium]|nr:acyl carrier protein [Oscillospiraceae bacterium]
MDSTFERIVEILREKCELDESVPITMDTTFKDIDLDSLSVVEIALECEDEFGIQIDVEEPPQTMGAFVELVESLLEA